MSWLAKSLANSFIPEDSDDSDGEEKQHSLPRDQHSDQDLRHPQQPQQPSRQSISSDDESPSAAAAGVKEDISELTKTLTRQFWGVASFLAPPPSSLPSSFVRSSASESNHPISHGSLELQDSDHDSAEPPTISGIRSDFAEIGGRFRSSISRLSGNKAVTEISKIASNFLPFGSDGKDLVGGAIGVTDEVLAFARNIAMHPETWLDFPLFVDDDYSDDFDMSDAQQEHALAVEHLAPRLAALRIELCPSHMSEGCFWKIYFVLLHSRLSKHDAELLLTPQIVEARAMWLQELQNRTKQESDRFKRSCVKDAVDPVDWLSNASGHSETTTLTTFAFESASSIPATDFETEKHPIVTSEMRMIDKSVVEEGPPVQTKSDVILSSTSKPFSQEYEDDEDDWLEEENDEMGAAAIPLGNEEDVSFSDLEDDYDGSATMSSKTLPDTSGVSLSGSRGWVQLDKNSGDAAKDGSSTGTMLRQAEKLNASHETKESSDWLDVEEDIDVV